MSLQKEQRRRDPFEGSARRRIALMFSYLGWQFDGLVCQEQGDGEGKRTVEECLFSALEKTKLVSDRSSCHYARCGRTDKGVSGWRQVASLIVRSNLIEGDGVFWPEEDGHLRCVSHEQSDRRELDFTQMLNGVLPRDMRILAWSPIRDDSFDARHSTTSRTYKYFFPIADMDITVMNDACQLLVGMFDFRNFCRIDKNASRLQMSYVRRIISASIESIDSVKGMVELTIIGSGFLWHQIRCIVSLLFEIGRHNETPELISQLLDVEMYNRRPQYSMAVETPLCLFECSYGDDQLTWQWDTVAIDRVIVQLQSTWTELQCKASMVQRMLSSLENDIPHMNGPLKTTGIHRFLSGNNHGTSKPYVPILKRPTCDGLEEKRDKFNKKNKLGIDE